MEGLRFSGFDGVGIVKKKPRSNTIRRPKPDTQPVLDTRNHSPLSTTPPSDIENANFDTSFRRKEFNLNHSAPRVSSSSRKIRREDGPFGEFYNFYNNGSSRGGLSTSNEHGRNGSDFKRCSEGVLAPANWKSSNKAKENFEMQPRNPDGYMGNGRNGDGRSSRQSGVVANGSGHRADSSSNESKLRKVKLKVGGVTRAIHAKSMLDSGSGNSSTKPSRSSDAPRPR